MATTTIATDTAGGTANRAAPWTTEDALALLELPFNDLIFRAQEAHRRHFDANRVQLSTLLSVKTGGCAEDCGYCAQSAHYDTGVGASKLMDVEAVAKSAAQAKAGGATRFCMGAAWRELKDRDVEAVAAMIREVKALGLESCMTLGMLRPDQARALADAGLDYYNHNIDTSPEHYGAIITTRTFEDRLDTLEHCREAGIKLCCGGILGMGEKDNFWQMGETRRDRASMLAVLASMEPPPESVPINQLMPMPGTPLATAAAVDPFEFVRTIAVARVTMPASMVRLAAGREAMSDELQALCFLAGANSIFVGDKLLTAPNPEESHDRALMDRLGLAPMNPTPTETRQ